MYPRAKLSSDLAVATIFGLQLACGGANAANISGAGSSFISPVLSKWTDTYRQRSGVSIAYRPIGSRSGVWLIRNRLVDFSLSDVGLSREELRSDDLMQFPIGVGAVVPIFNLTGIAPGQLKLTGPLLADIYVGKISKWNDPALRAANPGLALPKKLIFTAHRDDGSGTQSAMYEYLARTSAEWRRASISRPSMLWPYDRNGSEHVVDFVSGTDGALGYVEYAYAKRNNLAYALLPNGAGDYTDSPSLSCGSAVADVNLSAEGLLALPPSPAYSARTQGWPICGATYALIYRVQERSEAAMSLLRFFNWIYHDGTRLAEELDYVAVPSDLVRRIEGRWIEIQTPSGTALWSSRTR